MKIGIIGLGNMGGAILGGIVSKEIVEKENVTGFDLSDALNQRQKTATE